MKNKNYDNGVHTAERLKELQSLPLERKVSITQAKIIEWYNYFDGEVYVSFSGGKDSTVLLDIARKIFPDIKACFVDTGLEYPEIKEFVKSFDNVDIIRPEKNFKQVIAEYGYPVISKDISRRINDARKGHQGAIDMLNNCYKIEIYGNKSRFNCGKYKYLLDSDFNISNKCCNIMKKKPIHKYGKQTGLKPITATMADESFQRRNAWIKTGCNAFNSNMSNPMSFWTEQDVLRYIKENKIAIAKPYGYIVEDEKGLLKTTGCKRTGCIFCMFGCHLEKSPNRFEQLKETHSKLYAYCMNGGEYIDEKWQPNKEGLGLAHVLDYIGVKY